MTAKKIDERAAHNAWLIGVIRDALRYRALRESDVAGYGKPHAFVESEEGWELLVEGDLDQVIDDYIQRSYERKREGVIRLKGSKKGGKGKGGGGKKC